MNVIDAATSGNTTLLLAIMVLTLASVVSTVALVLFRELKDRAKRAEGLTDQMVKAFDELGPATQKAAEVAQAALDELRRR